MKTNTRVLQPSQPKSPLPYKRYARRQTTVRTWTFVKDWDVSKKQFPAKISPTAQVLIKADPKLSVQKKKKYVKDLDSSVDVDDGTSDILSDEGNDRPGNSNQNSQKYDIPKNDQEITETGHVLRSSSKKDISIREKTIDTSTLKENLLTPRSLRSKKNINLNTTGISPEVDYSMATNRLRSRKDSGASTSAVSPQKDNSLASRSLRSRNVNLDTSDSQIENSPKKKSGKLSDKSMLDAPNKITEDVEDLNVTASRTLRSSKKQTRTSTTSPVKQTNGNLKSANNRSIRQTHNLRSTEKENVSVDNVESVESSTESDIVKEKKRSCTFNIPVMVSSDRSPDSDQKTPEKLVLLHPETHPVKKSSEKKKRQNESAVPAEMEKETENVVTSQEKEHGSKSPSNKNNKQKNLEESIISDFDRDTEDSEMASVENDDVEVPVGQRSSSLFSSSLRSNKDFVDEQSKVLIGEDKMDEVDGVRDDDDDDDDDGDDEDKNDDDSGVGGGDMEMSRDEQMSQQNDGAKMSNMGEDDDVVMSNEEQISNEKSSSTLGKRKRSSQDKEQDDVEVTNLKVRNASKKGKVSGMKKITSTEVMEDRQELNSREAVNDNTVDKSVNVVDNSVVQISNSQHQQKSPQQNKLAVRFKPSEKSDRKKTDHGPGQSLPIWCGGLHQRYKKDVLDLDIVLDSVSNHLEEERNNCDSIAERKAVKKMMLYMKKEITDTIDKVESLKTVSISVKHSKKNIKELRQQLLNTGEEKSRLMSQIAEKKKRYNENLHRVNSWITGFEKLMHISGRKSMKMTKNQKLFTYGCFPV